MKRFKGSPMFINASRVKLPECEATADTIVQMLVEGYPDGFSQNARNTRTGGELFGSAA